jgi:ribosomal protein S18 acetylase RimI-like enzyme
MKSISINTIQKLEVDDYQLLADIGKKTLLESHGASAEMSIMEAYVSRNFSPEACNAELRNQENIFHAIYYKDKPAGYSKIIDNTGHPGIRMPNVTKMERLYLLQEFYSLKLGRELLRFNIELSRESGQSGMWLTVWTGNERAIKFYNRNGFKVIGEGSFKLTETHSNPTYEMFLEY